MRQAMKQAVRQWEDHHPICPDCGACQRHLEGTTRRVIATCFGRVEVQRRRFRCLACHRRCCPATRLFAPLHGTTLCKKQRDWQAVLALSGGGSCAQAVEWCCHQRRRNAPADQSRGQEACQPATRGGGAYLSPSAAGSRLEPFQKRASGAKGRVPLRHSPRMSFYAGTRGKETVWHSGGK
jgi:hypothetical protein